MIEQLKTYLQVTPEELKQNTILKRKGDVFYLLLNTKANAFTQAFIREIHAQLDKVEANEGATSLVTASLSKMFSGGLDLKVTSSLAPEDQRYHILEFVGLIGRVSVFPVPTLSLVRGGATAGGCMLAFAHDYVHVAGKAKFSTKQAQLQMFFPPGMIAVVKKRHAFPHVMRDMLIFAKEFNAEEALKWNLIDGIWSEQEALEAMHEKASDLSEYGYNKANMKLIKSQVYKSLTHDCFELQMTPSPVGFARLPSFPKL